MKSINIIDHMFKKLIKKFSGGIFLFVSVILFITIIFICSNCATGDKGDNVSLSRILNKISGEPVVPREANKIFIPLFENKTRRAEIAEKLFNRINERIGMDGRLAVVSDEKIADLKLEGVITDFTVQNLEYGTVGKPVKQRMRILASVRCTDLMKKSLIFYENDIQAFKAFSQVIHPIESEELVLYDVISYLADRIAQKTVTGWYTNLLTPVEKGKRMQHGRETDLP